MVESRWLRWVGPGVVALGAVGFIASTTLGAVGRPWVPSACAGPPADRIAAARDGTLSGQRLTLGLDGQRTARALDLAAEAFAAGPFGDVVLVGSDDGTASRV